MNEKFSFIAHRCRYYSTNNSMVHYKVLRQKKKSKNDSTVGQKSSKNYQIIFNVRGIYLFFMYTFFYLINCIFIYWSVYLL